MTVDSLAKPLLQLSLFRGLRPLQITEIARRAERIVYKPGDVLIEEGADVDAAIVIVSGQALRVSGPGLEERCEEVPVGALLAELGMLVETQATSTVVARSPVRALRITRAQIQAIMAEDAAVADHFVSKITERLARMAEELRRIEETLGGSEDEAVALALPPPSMGLSVGVEHALH